MFLSLSTGSLKFGPVFKQNQTIPTFHSQISETTNFSSKDNISHDYQNKAQNSKHNKKPITKTKLCGINTEQNRTMFKQKSLFTK